VCAILWAKISEKQKFMNSLSNKEECIGLGPRLGRGDQPCSDAHGRSVVCGREKRSVRLGKFDTESICLLKMSSSLKNVGPQRTYRERAQPSARKRLGLLEKKKDYKLRAKDFHRKEDKIKRLRQKAALKNPDEFYHAMINAGTKSKRFRQVPEDALKPRDADQHALVLSHDANYVAMKRSVELSKIESLKSALHFSASAGSGLNSRIVYVDSDEEEENRNADLETPQRKENVKGAQSKRNTIEEKRAMKADKLQRTLYRDLESRLDREEKLRNLLVSMDTERNLIGKGKRIRVKESDPYTGQPAVYKWKQQRKR